MRLITYTLRIEQAEEGVVFADFDREVLQTALQDAETMVNDALPEGFYCKIDETGEGVDLAAVRRLEAMSDGS